MKKIFTIFSVLMLAVSAFAELSYNTTLTQNDFNNSKTVVKKQGTIEWDGDHVRCGGSSNGISLGGPSWNWDDKYFDVKIANGVPNKLTFEWACNNITSTDAEWYVKESADGTNWSAAIWENNSSSVSWTSVTKDLQPNTRYIRFCFSGNFAGNFRNIKVTEKILMGTPNPTALDFGTVKVDDEASMSFTLGWTNLEVTVTGSTDQFTVTPESFGEIGAYTQTATISVALNTSVAGEYSTTVHVEGRGKSADVPVTAVVEKYDQTISWETAEAYAWGDVIALASATSGLDVTYEISDPTLLKYENGAFVKLHAGEVTVTAKQAGNYKYNAAEDVVRAFTIAGQITSAQESKTIVYGAEESWNGIDLSEYTVGTHTIPFETTNATGGVRTITLTLTVNKQETLNVPVELAFCPGGSETYRGVEYTEAGTYPVNAEGATRDTVYNVTVTILEPTFGTDSKTIVYGAQESWNGIDLSEYTVGTHDVPFTTTNVAGCDSTVTLNLTVNKQETLNIPVNLEFCQGGSQEYRGVEYTEAGTFNVPAEGATRDTVYNVTVTILQPTFGTDSKTIVYGAEESWNGINLSEYTVGTHTIPFVTTNAAGCDSTVTLNLTVNKQETLNVPVNLEFCVGGSETYRGVEYSEAGTFNVPAEGATRDTVYVVTVNVLQPTYGTDTKTIVVGAEESWNGIALQDSTVGVHYVVYETTNVAGCDSTVTLTLTVTKANVVEVPVELVFCQGDSVEYRGAWYTAAGLYPVYAEGEVADTVYNVNVTVNVPTFEEDEYEIQYGEEAEWNGIDLSGYTVGTHTIPFVTKNVAGCDSTITLTLTVEKMDEFEAEQELEFCEGDSVQYRGVWYAEAGEYPVYAEGEIRDTIINVIVTVHEKAYAEIERTVLAGNALTLPEGEWYLYDMPVEGEYQTLRSDTMGLVLYQYDETEFGCESVVKLIVTVTPNYEAIENVFVGEKAEKFFREGQLYIRRGEDIYTVTGERVE